jgi:arsenate reductase-like glutaredoxin family protein
LIDQGRKKVTRSWKKEHVLKFATWNVRGVHYKQEELDTILNDNNIKLAAITETKKETKRNLRISKLYNHILWSYPERASPSRSNVMDP